MPHSLLFLLFIIISSIIRTDSTLNITATESNRKVEIGEFPWQVAIIVKHGCHDFFCGGTLINNEWILTAAQCFPDVSYINSITCSFNCLTTMGAPYLLECSDPSAIVYLGIVDLKQIPNATVVRSEVIIKHPKFDATTLSNDIALIKLAQKVKFSDTVAPIRLSNLQLRDDNEVVASIWVPTPGYTSSSLMINRRLIFVRLRTITERECRNFYGTNGVFTEGTICATGDPINGLCLMDSGSSLIVPNYPPLHVGITSFTNRFGCMISDPQGFTSTSHYRNWIRNITGI